MKVNIIKDKCIGCGNCVALTEGQVFDFNEDGLAEEIVEIVPEEMEDSAKNAIIQCPTEAITEVTDEEDSISTEEKNNNISQDSTENINETTDKENKDEIK